jgi:Uncharacterized protein conserved in bacteria (DUF2059)
MLVRSFLCLSAAMALSGFLARPAAAGPVWLAESSVAPVAPEISLLSKTLQMDDIVAVMREEGLDYGATLEKEMFPGRGGATWLAVVGGIYDPKTMKERFDARLSQELAAEPEVLKQAVAFFGSAQGQNILTLELEARRALTDDAAEEAAKVKVEDMIAVADPRLEVLRAFAETNDLIEMNVTGALNANLAFYQGLREGGAFGEEMTDDQMLSDVWSQEAEVRGETQTWLFSYLALAYSPLPEADMAAYQAYSETPGGKRLNHALFAAFDAVFNPISHDMGVAAARQMKGDDI